MAGSISLKTERELADAIARYTYDFYGFIMFAYPWGVKGSQLERHHEGPEDWQKELADKMSAHARTNQFLRQNDMDMIPWQSVRASGHGVGKSAFVAWCIHWIMSTRPDARGTITANTGVQLETRTWPELAKWHNLLINKHWFQWTASSYYFAQYPEDKRKNYMMTAATVSKENTEAFAGLHNENSSILIIMDEMSGIEEKVIEVAKGALTDGEAWFLGFGNPTRPDGPFYDCFYKLSHIYDTGFIDSRTVRHTNKAAIAANIAEWGPDDDRTKYRVYGQFPSRSYNGFILPEAVDLAMERELFIDNDAALVLGVDVARYGDDETVLQPRRGRDARTLPALIFNGLNGPQVGEQVATWANRYKPDAIVIESVGPGLSVIDWLRERRFKVIEVHPGAPSAKKEYSNVRMEMWATGGAAITNGLCLRRDPQLYNELTKINYGIKEPGNKMFMESKKDMKARGQNSPDRADALMLTYAVTVPRRDAAVARSKMQANTAIIDYDVCAQ